MTKRNTEIKKENNVKDVLVKHDGVEIVLPIIDGQPMSYKSAIEWLERKADEENEITGIHYKFNCSPLDGLAAFHKALSKIYGWSQTIPTKSLFGPQPPVMIGVPVGPNNIVQMGYGRIQVPGIEGYFETRLVNEPHPAFLIKGEILKKYSNQAAKIAEMTKEFLETDSIYKGSAVKINFKWRSEHRDYDPILDAPQFMDLGNVEENNLIFSEEVMSALNIGLFTPIEYSDACREVGIPLKRGVLLYGPYGTGKTLTAYITALKAINNNWTFVYLDNVTDLKLALDFAAQYSPCVLFAEDIDRVMSGGRSSRMDDILNTLDGIDTKNAEIITVFTTNHIENINPATLRMGRLDTLVNVLPPDAKAAERLVRFYSKGLLDESCNLQKVGEVLAGRIPAFIREVVERAKMAAIARLESSQIQGKVFEEDLLVAASAMESHAELLNPRTKNPIDLEDVSVLIDGSYLQEMAQQRSGY